MQTERVVRVRRVLVVVCALAAAWAVVIRLTGGFAVAVGPVRISSRTPVNAIAIGVLAGLAAVALAGRDWRRSLREDGTWFAAAGTAARASLLARWQRFATVGIALPLAIVGVGLIVYQWTIARPLFVDEEMIALNVRDRSIGELAGALWLGQSAPYGWLALERAALLAFGTSERALRLVPAVFGIGTVAVAFWIGRRWMGALGSSVLMLLCAVGQWLSFYSVVAKPYSADAFWALLVPALGAAAIEAEPGTRQTRRVAAWWAVSAAGQWLANGALLVTPACALVMLATVWRRHGWRAARTFALFGVGWLACFGLHYFVSIRHSVNSTYLQHFWSWAMAPASAGPAGRIAWLAAQLKPLADNPGGAGLWVSFWLSAAAGLALAKQSSLRWLYATVPLSAFVLAALRMVPLYQRLALWAVPAMYVGIALLADRAGTVARAALLQRRWMHFAAAAILAFLAFQSCIDIFRRGRDDIRYGRPPDHNQQLDDRTAVRWLMRHARPGDAILTTHLALPAVWWYGGLPIAVDPSASQARVFEVTHQAGGTACERNQLREVLNGRTRALIYLGFRFGMAEEFDDLLLRTAGELGTVSAYSEFAGTSRAAVVDLDPAKAVAAPQAPSPRGCVAAEPGRRW